MAKKVLRFVSKGTDRDVAVYDGETNDKIQNCLRIEVVADATQPTRMLATFWEAEIDVTAEAEVTYEATVFPVTAHCRIAFIPGESPDKMRGRIAEAMTLHWWDTLQEKKKDHDG